MNDIYYRSCPVCYSSNIELLLSLDCGNIDDSRLYPTVKLMACSICGHAYNDLSPDEISSLGEYYNNEYAPANLNSVVLEGAFPGSTGKHTLNHYTQLYQVLSPHVGSCDAILDVGCAAGGFLDFLNGNGFSKLTGVDITEAYVEKARMKVEYVIEHGSAESLPFDDDIFDCVVIEQVLEHLVSPAIAFREAGRVLKMGGVLCIGVPDAALYSDFYFYDYFWLLLREHIQHFNINSLRRLAADAGFELLKYQQSSYAVTSDKMVMPNLCAVFHNKGLRRTSDTNISSNILPQLLKKYVEVETFHLSVKQAKLTELAKSQRPVYVWGVGREFLYLYEAAGLKHCNIVGIIDMNPFKQRSEKINHMKISSPGILLSASCDCVLVITAIAHIDAIKTELSIMGCKINVYEL